MASRRRSDRYVSASEIAQLGYCEQKIRLEARYGEAVTTEQSKLREAGRQEHARVHLAAVRNHNRPDATGPNYCFVATLVYGYDDERTWQLRRFRDRVLSRTCLGRWLVCAYYRTAPGIVVWLRRRPTATRIVTRLVDGIRWIISPWTGVSDDGDGRAALPGDRR